MYFHIGQCRMKACLDRMGTKGFALLRGHFVRVSCKRAVKIAQIDTPRKMGEKCSFATWLLDRLRCINKLNEPILGLL